MKKYVLIPGFQITESRKQRYTRKLNQLNLGGCQIETVLRDENEGEYLINCIRVNE